MTCNRTREVHDALKRRCLYHWVEHPDPEREAEILRRRLPEVSRRLAAQVAAAAARLRGLDWSSRRGWPRRSTGRRRCDALGADELDRASWPRPRSARW